MADLDQALRTLEVDWPATPDLASAVHARIAQEPAPRPRRRAGLPARPALAWAMAAIFAVAAAGLAASPSARSAILEWLGLRSARIERREPTGVQPAPPSRQHPGDTLGLGEYVRLDDARRRANFTVRLPTALGDPQAVYFAAEPEGGRVSLVYDGLLVTQFRATVSPVIEKSVGAGARLERITVDGAPGYFIAGRPHGFAWVGPDGEVDFEEPRLAGPTLLVESGGLLLRLEGEFSRGRAVELARSMLP